MTPFSPQIVWHQADVSSGSVRPNQTPDADANDPCDECPRHFYFIHADAGDGAHNLGRALEVAAETHKKEVENGKFPFDVPHFRKNTDVSHVVHISRVAEFRKILQGHAEDVHYVAIFSHMGAGGKWFEFDGYDEFTAYYARTGLVFFGEESAPDTNMGQITEVQIELNMDNETVRELLRARSSSEVSREYRDELLALINTNNTSPDILPRAAFSRLSDTQIRLFGCYGATGGRGDPLTWSTAEALHHHLGIKTYGYSNEGGSMITDDPKLGHGERNPTAADQRRRNISDQVDLWFVPYRDRLHFEGFLNEIT